MEPRIPGQTSPETFSYRKRTGRLEAGRSAAGREAIFEERSRQGAGRQGGENHERSQESDDGRHIRLAQVALGKKSYETLMIGIVAIGMNGVMQRRAGGQRQKSEELENQQRGQDCFCSPAKTRMLPRYPV
jgi:hypothetical protein